MKLLSKRLNDLEARDALAAGSFAVTLSDSERPLAEVEADYIAKHGFDPNREWLHIRFVGVQPQRGYDDIA